MENELFFKKEERALAARTRARNRRHKKVEQRLDRVRNCPKKMTIGGGGRATYTRKSPKAAFAGDTLSLVII